MTDSERISRLERICRMQQTLIEHQVNVTNRLLEATGVKVGTQMLDNAGWHALTSDVKSL